MFDGQALGQQIAAMIKVAINDALVPLQEQMKSLEMAQLAAPGMETFKSLAEAQQATWALDFERRAQGLFEKALEAIPKPRDAFSLDDLDLALAEDGRTLTASFKAGEQVLQKSIVLPVLIDCGVFSPDRAYAKGDAVSWGGSLWISQKDAPEGKPEQSGDWRLAVKRGRDGRDAK